MKSNKKIEKYLTEYIDKPYYEIVEEIIKIDSKGNVKERIVKTKKVPLYVNEVRQLLSLLEEINASQKIRIE